MDNVGGRGLAVVVLALAVGGCGESSEEQAQNAVCDARADMAAQIQTLKGGTVTNVTSEFVAQSVDQLLGDVKTITEAQSDLSDDRRQEVEAANKAFASSIRSAASQVVSSGSAGGAGAAVTTAVQQLEASYQQTFAPIDCN